jgi:hypothetical protein
MADLDGRDDAPVIPGYRLVRLLGEGGMGRVYLAEDPDLGRRAAIKVVSRHRVDSEEARARFRREARALASVEHPGVVRVYGFGDAGGQPYLAMEYVEGESLADRLRRERALPVAEAVRIVRSVAEALAAAWEGGLVHRDVKPSNILLDRKGQVRVADFGLAKGTGGGSSDPTLTREGAVVGSPAYLSPEQARGLPVDFRTDVYSLGVVLYEALAGSPPFQGPTPADVVAQHLYAGLPALAARRPGLPAEVLRVVEWMTQKDPAQRPGSYPELLSRLTSLAEPGDMDSQSTMALTGTTPRRPVRLRPWLRPALLSAGLLLVVAAVFVPWRGPARPAPSEPSALAVAVAPFYGPDEESAREGRVMAALIQGEVSRRLGGLGARVLGPDETRTAVRDHAAARALGERMGASVVIWGEAFAVRGETEIQPYFTLVPPKRGDAGDGGAPISLRARDALEGLGERSAGPVVLAAQAANQIGLRRTGAAGVGELVLVLAGVHALYAEGRPETALAWFDQAPRSAESLRYRAEALDRLGRSEEALANARGAVAAEPSDASAQALLGDLALKEGQLGEAVAAHRRAAESGKPYVAHRALYHSGRLFVREVFRSARYKDGEEQNSGYLVALDPTSGRVLERHRCPGPITALRPAREGFEITYSWTWLSAADEDSRTARIGFSNSGFDRPVFWSTSLLERRLSVRSGWPIASNFIGLLGPSGFELDRRSTTPPVPCQTWSGRCTRRRSAIRPDPGTCSSSARPRSPRVEPQRRKSSGSASSKARTLQRRTTTTPTWLPCSRRHASPRGPTAPSSGAWPHAGGCPSRSRSPRPSNA